MLRRATGPGWRQRGALALALTVALAPAAAAQHGHAPHLGWRLDPHLLAALALAAALYARGVMVLWRRAGAGGGIPRWRAASFAAGFTILALALTSPLDALADELASAHMLQHLSMMLLASPLIVLGAPGFAMLWALPPRWRQRGARWWRRARGWRGAWQAISQPVIAWTLYLVILWGWHLPMMYEAAIRNQWVHDLQHLLFVAGAGLLWFVVLNPVGQLRLSGGAGVLYLFTTSMHAMALGVFMTLSPQGWYRIYDATTAQWGLSLLQDQQIAGAMMWMPAALVYVVLAALIFTYWLRESESAAERLARLAVPADARDAEFERHLQAAEEP
jgi:putative membrane protein